MMFRLLKIRIWFNFYYYYYWIKKKSLWIELKVNHSYSWEFYLRSFFIYLPQIYQSEKLFLFGLSFERKHAPVRLTWELRVKSALVIEPEQAAMFTIINFKSRTNSCISKKDSGEVYLPFLYIRRFLYITRLLKLIHLSINII